jgi:hypothetical protein
MCRALVARLILTQSFQPVDGSGQPTGVCLDACERASLLTHDHVSVTRSDRHTLSKQISIFAPVGRPFLCDPTYSSTGA